MFTLADLRALLDNRPFAPFRLHRSDGGTVEVRHQELVFAGRRYAVVGLPDAAYPEASYDRHMIIWYMHVTRTEMLGPGPAPLPPSSGQADSQTPSSV